MGTALCPVQGVLRQEFLKCNLKSFKQYKSLIRHSRDNGNPRPQGSGSCLFKPGQALGPAFAGATIITETARFITSQALTRALANVRSAPVFHSRMNPQSAEYYFRLPLLRWRQSERLGLRARSVLHRSRCMHARRRGRASRRGAEGATAPETLRQKDRGRKGALESSDREMSTGSSPKE